MGGPLLLQGRVGVEQQQVGSEMCTQALTGCPARSGSNPAASSRRMR
jgi:hypothetical protein